MSDGGGPADTNQATKIQEKLEEAHKALFSPLVYHPLALPKPRGSVDIDAQTLDILTSTHKLLNSSNPAFAGDCWLCLHPGTPIPLSLPLPEKDFNATTLCRASSPFLVRPYILLMLPASLPTHLTGQMKLTWEMFPLLTVPLL